MPRYNSKNERIKKDYFRFLKEADRKSDSTIDAVRKAISRYETYTGLKDFATFNREQAIAFKRPLANTKARRAACQGDVARDHQCSEGVFKMAFVPAWLQVPDPGHGH